MKKILVALLVFIPLLLIAGCSDDNEKVVYGGEIPAIPSSVWTVTHDQAVEVFWSANRDDGLTDGYGVYRFVRALEDYDEYELIATIDADRNDDVVSYRDQGLQNGHTYYYAVNAHNGNGESELSYELGEDTPRHDGDASVYDYVTKPETAGFDFSRFGTTDWEDPDSDIFFEYDAGWDLFYVNVAGRDYEYVDIQDYGYVDDIYQVNWGQPGDGWSTTGWLPLTVGHAYLVWTADDHYAAFRVNSVNGGTGRVGITWSYQTAESNPELKRRALERPQHAENYGRREG